MVSPSYILLICEKKVLIKFVIDMTSQEKGIREGQGGIHPKSAQDVLKGLDP